MIIKTVKFPNQVTLPYVEQGDPVGPPLLLLHGYSGSLYSFEPLLDHLSTSIHAFALTQRGHGDASKPEGPYTLDVFAADAAAFLRAMNLESATVLGHSMGSAVALRMALDYPERVRALVLIGAGPLEPGGPKERVMWETTLSKLEDPIDPLFVRKFIEGVYVGSIPEERVEATVQNSQKMPARVWRAVMKGRIEGAATSGDLSEIGAPTLIVWGDQDIHFDRSKQDALLAAIPNSRLKVYPGMGHGPHAAVPEQLASDVTAFVFEVAQGS